MKAATIAVTALLWAGLPGAVQAAVFDMQLDAYVAGAEATIKACGKIAPAGTKRLSDALASVVKKEKQSFEALRKTPAYAKEFKKESDRWLYMSDKNRNAGCKELNNATYP